MYRASSLENNMKRFSYHSSRIALRENLRETKNNSGTATLRMLLLCPLGWPRTCPTFYLNLHLESKRLCLSSKAWKSLDKTAIFTSLRMHCTTGGMYCHGSWNQIPHASLFYYGDRPTRLALPSVNLISKMHPYDDLSWVLFKGSEHLLHQIQPLYDIPEDHDAIWQFLRDRGNAPLPQNQPRPDSKCLIFLPRALDACIAWVENPKYHWNITKEELGYNRAALRFQLYEVRFSHSLIFQGQSYIANQF